MAASLKVARARRRPRAVWDDAVDKAAERMQDLASRFTEGELNGAEYELGMRSLVKSLHMGAVAVGSGGIDKVTPTDLRRLGPLLRDEYKFLRRRVAAFESGGATAAQVVATVPGYAKQARSTFENKRREKAAPEFTKERWVRHNDDSCPGCVRQGSRGVLPRGVYPPHGSQDCGGSCLCTVELVS